MHNFRPIPFLGNAHVQTLLGTLLPARPLAWAVERRLVALPDGDRLMLHDSVPPGWRPGQPVAILVHGLTGCHRSGYMLRTAGLLLRRGLRVVRLDLRGCGAGVALARRTYNAACSEDVRAAADLVRSGVPTSPLFLMGFSLGGNIVLKLAGEAADRPLDGLARVAALAPPIDLEHCAGLLARPRNRVYDRHFARSLTEQVLHHRRHFPDLPALDFPHRLTMRGFDELYTAPQGGFADALDYYRRSSSHRLIPRIEVPTLIVTARDDPFIAIDPFEALTLPPHVELRIVPRGGHLGFLGWDGAGGFRWAERRLVEWVTRA